jgi:hypothetical protein
VTDRQREEKYLIKKKQLLDQLDSFWDAATVYFHEGGNRNIVLDDCERIKKYAIGIRFMVGDYIEKIEKELNDEK